MIDDYSLSVVFEFYIGLANINTSGENADVHTKRRPGIVWLIFVRRI